MKYILMTLTMLSLSVIALCLFIPLDPDQATSCAASAVGEGQMLVMGFTKCQPEDEHGALIVRVIPLFKK